MQLCLPNSKENERRFTAQTSTIVQPKQEEDGAFVFPGRNCELTKEYWCKQWTVEGRHPREQKAYNVSVYNDPYLSDFYLCTVFTRCNLLQYISAWIIFFSQNH